MYNWQTRFNERRSQFISRSLERLAGIDGLIGFLEQRPGDLGLLKQIAQHFHQLNGAAGIYEMNELCKLAGHGEDQTIRLVSAGGGAGPNEIAGLREIVKALRLQLSGQQGAAETAPALESPGPATSAVEVVMAIPDQTAMYAITRLLEQKNIAVRPCRTAAAAKEAISQRLPEGLILGIPLPDSLGFEVARDLRAMPGGQRTAIIVLSQEARFPDKVVALRSGADALFEHPLDHDKVVAKMLALMDRDRPQSLRVLSVEDDPDQAAFIRSVLETAGYNVATIDDPRHFEETLIRFDPHILLLDIMLGEMNGFELAKYVRQSEKFANLPILFLTTQNQLNFHIQSARVGGDDHLVKPVAPPLLVAAVAGRLERYRALQKQLGRDALTGWLTHGTFMEQAARIVANYDRKYSVALIVFDIDNMQSINDRCGYAAGDKVILSLANLLKQGFRQSDRLGRIDGDEFAVILDDLDYYELESLTTHALQEFEQVRHLASGTPFQATASAGIAVLQPGMDLRAWGTAAEQALRQAKEKGRNRAVTAQIAHTWERGR